ncbi:MAG: TIGR01459 family HAD-type hydrolase [Granulosicoccus sp.]|nr:TIGR01459 family HAD-type hydrolase [Granulosicoccus sp.]
MTKQLDGLSSIVSEFDVFLIDQYGVLHNGVEPYPGAVETLTALKAENKQTVVLSNSGKRSVANIQRMASLGFADTLFDHFISSGEVAHRYLKAELKDQSPRSCYLISRDDDVSAVEELDLEMAMSPDDADLILISGSEAERYSETEYRELLSIAAGKGTTCLCTNPDKKMLMPDGLFFGAGRIAEIYEELGGTVNWIGKPHPGIYQYVLTLFADIDRERILCVGDSIEHDIAGGHAAQLKTLLVRTGILTEVNDQQLNEQFEKYQMKPDYILDQLCM